MKNCCSKIKHQPPIRFLINLLFKSGFQPRDYLNLGFTGHQRFAEVQNRVNKMPPPSLVQEKKQTHTFKARCISKRAKKTLQAPLKNAYGNTGVFHFSLLNVSLPSSIEIKKTLLIGHHY